MRQLAYFMESPKDYLMARREVRAAVKAMSKVSCILATVFFTPDKRDMALALAANVEEDFPSADVAGGEALKLILNGQFHKQGVTLTFTLFENSRAFTCSYSMSEMTPEEIGADVLRRMEGTVHLKAVSINLAGIEGIDLNPLWDSVSRAAPEVRFFGGMSEKKRGGGLLLRQGMAGPAVSFTFFLGEDLHFDIRSNFGWKPLGRSMTVTKLKTPYIVKELDHEPAAGVYEKYLGIGIDGDFIKDAVTFPCMLVRKGAIIARNPIDILEDGSLVFSMDFEEGEQVRLAYGDPAGIIRNAGKMSARLAAFHPQCIMSVSCLARWMLMGEDVEHELRGCRSLAPMNGYYSFGEIIRNEGRVMLSSMTLVLVAMREGAKGTGEGPVPAQDELHLSDPIVIMSHLVHFIAASSRELEEANVKLRKMASTDGLTALLNRSEIEHVLLTKLKDERRSQRSFSVLMLDLDDFKTINDSYGHDVGDKALRLLADVIRRHIRDTDCPGRWGGDEFFVILSGATAREAEALAERIRRSVEESELLPAGQHVTASIGVTSTAPGDTPLTLFKRADKALYEAKGPGGKNCVRVVSKAGADDEETQRNNNQQDV